MSDTTAGGRCDAAGRHLCAAQLQTLIPHKTVQTLKSLLKKGDHAGFLSAYGRGAVLEVARNESFLPAAGTGLMLLLDESEPSRQLLERYGEFVLAGLAKPPASIVSELANRLSSPELLNVAAELLSRECKPEASKGKPTSRSRKVRTESRPIFQVRRVIQTTRLAPPGSRPVSALLAARRSVFRSPQERTFLRALSARFPAFLALPNYPFDQVVDLNRIRSKIDEETLRYARHCRIDAVLVLADEGDPIAAFELDSRLHDDPEAAQRDAMKNRLFKHAGLPLFRLRADFPESVTTDEWYAFLTDEVMPTLDTGFHIPCRNASYGFVPVA